MRRVAIVIVVLAACADDTTPAWQLDHDRIVAVRATPPHIVTGQTARLTALLATERAPTSEAEPTGASAPFAPAGLFAAVHFNLDHWEINAPDGDQLALARAELELPDGAPVPLSVTLQFPGRLFAEKIVWLGDTHDNPVLPGVSVAGVEPADEITITGGRDIALLIEVSAGMTVRWLTSCGELENDDKPEATLRARSPCEGELIVVVRDALSGVVWRAWPLHVQ